MTRGQTGADLAVTPTARDLSKDLVHDPFQAAQ